MTDTPQSVLEGEIPEGGIVTMLLEIEALRTTGVLRFSGPCEGEVSLVLGQISADQDEREDEEDPIELLLAMTSGHFEIIQRLPPLPVSKGDTTRKEGSLEVHVPADLMNYCERAGLTGMLSLEQDDMRAEVRYERGELDTIRLDGLDDLHHVFGWDEGHFVVDTYADAPWLEDLPDPEEEPEEVADEADADEAKAAANPPTPKPKPPRPDTTGQQFLRVVEVTLAEVLREREERRPPTRTSPPLPDLPKPKKHATLLPPGGAKPKRKERKDQTVRVIYLGADVAKAPPVGVRHVQKGVVGEEELPEAAPARRGKDAMKEAAATADQTPAEGQGDKGDAKGGEGKTKELPTIVWALIAVMIALTALTILAALPPVD